MELTVDELMLTPSSPSADGRGAGMVPFKVRDSPFPGKDF